MYNNCQSVHIKQFSGMANITYHTQQVAKQHCNQELGN